MSRGCIITQGGIAGRQRADIANRRMMSANERGIVLNARYLDNEPGKPHICSEGPIASSS